MGNIFGKRKKPSRVTEQDRAVLQLKQQRDKMKQYQKKIQAQLEKERELARELLKVGKKERAKLLLRKKKFQEGLLDKTDQQLDNIERMVQDIEFTQIESKVVEGLKTGNEALKKMHQLMSLEDVEKIMDETQEGIEYQREIDALLAGGLTDQDEEDVQEELDKIIAENLPETPTSEKQSDDLNLPDVPTGKIKDKEQPKEKEAILAS